MLSNNSPLAKYLQIKDFYLKKIKDGSLSEGDVIPSERQLSKESGISIGTIRQAYEELQKEGYIQRIQGKGTVVVNTAVEASVLTIGSYEPPVIYQGLRALAERWNSFPGSPFQLRTVSVDPQVPLDEAFRLFDIVLPAEEALTQLRESPGAESLIDKVDTSSFNDKAMANYSCDPLLRAVPLTFSPFLMGVNNEIVSRTGLDMKTDWDWQRFKDFFDRCAALKNDGIYAFSTSLWPYRWLPFLWQNDCPVFKAEGNPDKSSFEEALRFVNDIFTSPSFFTQNSYNMVITPERLFPMGRTGLVFFAYYHLNAGVLDTGIDWSLASFPSHKSKSTSIYSVALAVSKYTKKKTECIEFLKRIFSDEWQLAMLESSNFMPVRNIDNNSIKKKMGKKAYGIYARFMEELPFAYPVIQPETDRLRLFWQQFGLVLSGLAPMDSMWELYNHPETFLKNSWLSNEKATNF